MNQFKIEHVSNLVPGDLVASYNGILLAAREIEFDDSIIKASIINRKVPVEGITLCYVVSVIQVEFWFCEITSICNGKITRRKISLNRKVCKLSVNEN